MKNFSSSMCLKENENRNTVAHAINVLSLCFKLKTSVINVGLSNVSFSFLFSLAKASVKSPRNSNGFIVHDNIHGTKASQEYFFLF